MQCSKCNPSKTATGIKRHNYKYISVNTKKWLIYNRLNYFYKLTELVLLGVAVMFSIGCMRIPNIYVLSECIYIYIYIKTLFVKTGVLGAWYNASHNCDSCVIAFNFTADYKQAVF